MIIGVLLDWFTGGYQNQLVDGIEEEAQKRGIKVIYFSGRQYESARFDEAYHTRIYELIDFNIFDGLLIPISVMDCCKPEEYYNIISRFARIRVVTLSFKCPPFLSVNINNKKGFRELLEHLIAIHGYRKFAFINGPGDHADAIQRLSILKEVLTMNNIEIDEDKRFSGQFIIETGMYGVIKFLDEKRFKLHEDIEAIICSSDLIAIGVLHELEERGFSIPRDVAVTGFDNIEEARNRIIPIATVSHPIREMGRRAVEAFALNKKQEKILPTNFIARGTCGCHLKIPDYRYMTIPHAGKGIKESLIEEVRKIIFPAGLKDRKAPEIEEVVDLFLAPPLKSTITDIESKLFSIMVLWAEKWENLAGWQNALIFLEENIPHNEKNSGEQKRAFLFAQMVIADLYRRIEMKKRAKVEESEERLHWVNDALNASSNLDDISIYLSDAVRNILGVKSCYIFLYDDPGDFRHNFRFLNNEKTNRAPMEQKHKIFPDFTSIAETLLSTPGQASLVIQPLIFESYSMGFFIMEFNENARMAYEGLRIHLSTALKHSFTIIESENRNWKFKKLQGKLVQSAHQAGMAQIAIHLMHTIGNISNSAFVTIDMLNDSLKDSVVHRFRKANELLKNNIHHPDFFFKKDPRGKILPDYYQKLTGLLEQENSMIKKNVRELAEIISGMVRVIDSQQELSEGFFILESVNLIECLENSLILTADALKKAGILLIKKYKRTDTYDIKCYKNTLLHIIVKLLDASIGRTRNAVDRKITISAGYEKEKILLQIAHSGCGIKKEDLTEIFNQNYENQYIRTGIDLHFIANTLKEIGASINAESEGEARGAVFTITFPKDEAVDT